MDPIEAGRLCEAIAVRGSESAARQLAEEIARGALESDSLQWNIMAGMPDMWQQLADSLPANDPSRWFLAGAVDLLREQLDERASDRRLGQLVDAGQASEDAFHHAAEAGDTEQAQRACRQLRDNAVAVIDEVLAFLQEGRHGADGQPCGATGPRRGPPGHTLGLHLEDRGHTGGGGGGP